MLFVMLALLLNNTKPGTLQPYPTVTCSADMGWQKRSSGRRYDSNSGHAFLVDSVTRRPIAMVLKSKICSIRCQHKPGSDVPVREHKCQINHVGSSGSMEPAAIKDMVVWLHDEKQVLVSKLITDDDSSIKAKLKWCNADWMANNNTTTNPKIIKSRGNEVNRPDHGELPAHIAEPTFAADPNH